MGCVLRPEKYPGDWQQVLMNVTAFRTSYNGEAWFLFPYILLSLTSVWVFRLLDKWGCIRMLAASYVLYFLSCFLISRYYLLFFDGHYAVYHIVLYFDTLFCFVMGAAFCKLAGEPCGCVGMLLRRASNKVKIVALLVVWLLRCVITISVAGPFLVGAFALLFIHIDWGKCINRCLQFVGKYSMEMWLIHSYFFYYLFKDFVYGLHSPTLMYLVVFALSLVSAVVIRAMVNGVMRLVKL